MLWDSEKEIQELKKKKFNQTSYRHVHFDVYSILKQKFFFSDTGIGPEFTFRHKEISQTFALMNFFYLPGQKEMSLNTKGTERCQGGSLWCSW